MNVTAETVSAERLRLAAVDPEGEDEALDRIPYEFMERDAVTGDWHLPSTRQDARPKDVIAYVGARSLSTIDRSPPGPLLVDRLDPGGHTIAYGTGGVGKGTLATWWAVQLVRAGHRVLILDYENHPDEWARRWYGLAGDDGAEHVTHVAPLSAAFQGPRGPIWANETAVRDLTIDLDITYVIVDSIVTACGGADPTDPGTPARYAGALQFIDLPTLSLAHVTKADDLRYPFGSIFWHNLARVTWSLAKDGQRVVMANRKANNYANRGRVVVTTTYRDDLPVDIMEQGYSALLADFIDETLGDAALSVAEIGARLNQDLEEDAKPIKLDSIRAALRRGAKADPKRYTVEGGGDTARWSRP